MVGQPVAGAWLLRVTDASQDDAGTFDRWRIEITVGT
jgi:subtilisin-like proprotein convertase family protein